MPTPSGSPVRFIDQLEPVVYPAIRILAGILFALHGASKLFGVLGTAEHPAQTVDMFSQIGIGGVIELGTGVLMAVGLFTRAAAFVASGQMAVAYFQFHVASTGYILPIQNGGDDTVMYCFWFFFVFVRGPGALAVDNRIFGRHSAS